MPQIPRDELNVDELNPVAPFRRSPYGDQSHLASVIERARQGSSHADILNRRLLEADELLTKMPPANSTPGSERPLRIAVVSLLFNWPSTGGGIVHTAELIRFLAEAGYEVCHFFAVFEDWGVGKVTSHLPYPAVAIEFGESGWNRDNIQHAFRNAVDGFSPDCAIVTDSWNSKGLLAKAVSNYPYFIRLAAMECICPLNNVRLLPGADGRAVQCRKSQLATRNECVACVERNAHASGSLHDAERRLVGFSEPRHFDELIEAFATAEAVLAVNPLIATHCEPYAKDVRVIASGFDPFRFAGLPAEPPKGTPFRLLFAGLVDEYMKGFHVLFEACCILWAERQDFELHVTSDTLASDAPFLKPCGWQTQESLPGMMADCHAVIVPTVAQEALGRTAVEAMGASRPVIASRLGGLPFVVTDEVTGLLFEPEDAAGLADCIKRLMDNPAMAADMGAKGRARFLSEHTWDTVIRTKYQPLFARLRSHR